MTMLSRRVIRLADEVHGVLEEARKLKINLSAVLTEALLEKFCENRRETWLQENKESIESVNQWADGNGSFSDFQRPF